MKKARKQIVKLTLEMDKYELLKKKAEEMAVPVASFIKMTLFKAIEK